MKVKRRFFPLLTLLTALLLALILWASSLPLENLSIIYPVEPDFFSIDSKALEEGGVGLLPLSFLHRSKVDVKALNNTSRMDQITTTPDLLSILNYPIIAGDFIPPKEKGNYLVLNQKAALELFGSTNVVGEVVNMGEEIVKIAGVINDYHDKSIIYTGGTVSQAPLLLYSTNNDFSHSRSLVSYTLQSLGILEGSYKTLSLNEIVAAFSCSFKAALFLLVGLLSLSLFCSKRLLLKQQLASVKSQFKEYSFWELGRNQPQLLLRLLGLTALTFLSGFFFFASTLYFAFAAATNFKIFSLANINSVFDLPQWFSLLQKGIILYQLIFLLMGALCIFYAFCIAQMEKGSEKQLKKDPTNCRI